MVTKISKPKVAPKKDKKESAVKQEDSTTLKDALKHFETAEANLVKLERLWKEIQEMIPDHIAFGPNPEYDEKCRIYKTILPHLPRIDGWSPSKEPMELDDIAHSRFEAQELNELSVTISVEDSVNAPGTELERYRIHLKRKRKELTRASMKELIELADKDVTEMSKQMSKWELEDFVGGITAECWASLEDHVNQIATLLGSSNKPLRWSDLRRHMSFAEPHDVKDIVNTDWPIIKANLESGLFDENDPIPSEIEDLSALVAAKPKGTVPKGLKWKDLTPEEFERLIFTLVSSSEGYENAQWLMHTNAPDKGRDISVYRVVKDALGGTFRSRVIIQCKRWSGKGISVSDIQTLQAQMRLWEPPRVDVHIIATTGRFSSDAVSLVEKENLGDKALSVEMWPESHLERILASRPDLIAYFNLR